MGQRHDGEFILLNDFTCPETRLHNAGWFKRMITLGSIQCYMAYAHRQPRPAIINESDFAAYYIVILR